MKAYRTRKSALVCSLVICLSVAGVFSGNLFVRDVYAIPNSNVPAPDGHPHTCGETRFPAKFIDGTVTWTNATVDPYDASGILQNPDIFSHQHHCDQSFGGYKGNRKYSLRESYDAYSCWDNRVYRYSLLPPPALFNRGHGFINEFSDAGGGPASCPHYYFSPNWTDGTTPCNWDANAQDMISEAFETWGRIESDKPYLATGIAFEPTSNPADADIRIFWQNESVPYWQPATRRLVFPSNRTWYFGKNPLGTPIGQYHFFTIALHEVGHIVGLDDQCDTDDIMYYLERWEYLYNDTDGSGTVTPSDVRLYNVELSGTPPGYPRGSTVVAGDNDERQRPRRILVNFNPNEKHDNTTGNNRYDWGEFIYRDVDNSGNVTAGDIRMEERGVYAAGSVVTAGDTDVGLKLVPFLANEKHEEFLPNNGRYDFLGPYLGDIDDDSKHGVRDLYSIPAPDFGDAPDPPYPTKKASNGARNLFIGREWLGPNPTGQTTTTWEWDARAVDNDDGVTIVWLTPTLLMFIVTITAAGQPARYDINNPKKVIYLNAWVDWNNDGSWAQAIDQIVSGVKFAASTVYIFTIALPPGVIPQNIGWARFRIDYSENINAWIGAGKYGGEVEDHKIPSPPPHEGPVLIGVVRPWGSIQGIGIWEGAQMARDIINAYGGMPGSGGERYQVELVDIDEHSFPIPDPTSAVQELIHKLEANPNMKILIGGVNTECLLPMREAAMDYAAVHGRPIWFITGAADNELIDDVRENYDRYKYMFRTTFNQTTLTKVLLFGLIAQVVAPKLSVLYDVSPVPTYIIAENLYWCDKKVDIIQTYGPMLTEFGFYTNLEIVGVARPSSITKDFSLIFADIQASGAKLIIHMFSGVAGTYFITQWGLSQIEAVPVGMNEESQIQEFYDAIDGLCEYETILAPVGTRTNINPNAKPLSTAEFWDAYSTTYGHAPIYTSWNAYDAIIALNETASYWICHSCDEMIPIFEATDRMSILGRFKYTGPNGIYHDVYCALDSLSPVWPTKTVRPLVVQWQAGRMEVMWPRDQPYSRKWMFPSWMYSLETDFAGGPLVPTGIGNLNYTTPDRIVDANDLACICVAWFDEPPYYLLEADMQPYDHLIDVYDAAKVGRDWGKTAIPSDP